VGEARERELNGIKNLSIWWKVSNQVINGFRENASNGKEAHESTKQERHRSDPCIKEKRGANLASQPEKNYGEEAGNELA